MVLLQNRLLIDEGGGRREEGELFQVPQIRSGVVYMGTCFYNGDWLLRARGVWSGAVRGSGLAM